MKTNGRKKIQGDHADCVAGSTAKLEPVACNAPLAKEAFARCNGPVVIRVKNNLRRIRDADGSSSKYAIDSLVSCGILPGDGPEIIAAVSHSQAKTDEDSTEIIIAEA